jgi:hypothetical protein
MGLKLKTDGCYINGEKVGIVTDFNIGPELLQSMADVSKSIGDLSYSFEATIEDSKPLFSWLKKFCSVDHKAAHYFRTRAKRLARGRT